MLNTDNNITETTYSRRF